MDSVHPRQAVVSKNHVDRAPVQNMESVLTAGHGDNLVPGGLQSPLQWPPENFVVIDDQNPNAHVSSTVKHGHPMHTGCLDYGDAKCSTL